jgi:signal transduction histidine kinase
MVVQAPRNPWFAASRRLLGIVGLLLGLAWPGLGGTPTAPLPQDILVLYSYNQNLPAQARITAGLMDVIGSGRMQHGSFHHEYLDISPPRSPAQRRHLAELLKDKYGGMSFALIVTVFDAARDFLVKEGRGLSPGTPALALFGQPSGAALLDGRRLFELPLHFELRGTLEQALALFPNTRKVVFVSGTSEANLRVEAQARQDFAPWKGRLAFDFTSDRPLARTLDQAGYLSPDTIILCAIVSSDVTGEIFVPQDVVAKLTAAANAPVFTILSSFVGEGVVGGAVVDPGVAGGMLARAVQDLQLGRTPVLQPPSAYVKVMFDWRALERWGCDASRVPRDAIFLGRPLSLWGQYRGFVIGTLATILVLSAMILALLALYHRKTRAEQDSKLAEATALSLYAVSEATQAADDLQDLFRRVHGMLGRSQPLRNFSIALFDEGTRQFTFPYHADEFTSAPPPRAPGAGLVEWVLQTGRPLMLSRERDSAPLKDGRIVLTEPEPGDWLGLPLQAQGRTLGVLAVQTYARGDTYSERELDLLQCVATQVAAGIERRQADQDRQRMQEELEHTQRLESLGSLASGIAHDMNNILASIQAVAQALRLQYTQAPALASPLATIERACLRGGDLVKGLTNFARKSLRESRVLELNDLVREETAMLRRTLLQRVEVVELLEPDLPPIRGEATTLGSVILNLCVNASDAMPRGGTLTLRTTRAEGNWVQLSVEDTGEGMPPEVLRRAMEPFFTTKPFGKGTGLGLSMVFNTIKAHGGTVQLHSEVGAGTTVLIRLPGLEADAPELTAAADQPSPHPSLRLLLVDDDALIRATIPMLMAQLGHTVAVAEGGAEALVRLEAGLNVDLVLLDLNMPVMGGVETLHNLRRRYPELPAILATGFLDEATESLLARTPRTAVLTKPYTLDQFQDRVRDLGL